MDREAAASKKRDYIAYLMTEGILNDQYKQIEDLQDADNPNFVVEVVTLFFEDSEKLVREMYNAFQQENVDFKKLQTNIHQLKGSSSSIGAQRMQDACIAFRNCCSEKNTEECLKWLEVVNNECSLFKSELGRVLQFEQQEIQGAGQSFPKVVGGF